MDLAEVVSTGAAVVSTGAGAEGAAGASAWEPEALRSLKAPSETASRRSAVTGFTPGARSKYAGIPTANTANKGFILIYSSSS